MESLINRQIQTRIEGNIARIRVLMFHHIVPENGTINPSNMVVQASNFRRQLELLDRWGYTTITFDDVKLILAGELTLPNKPVMITFDDGYADVYETAFPILREFGMRAVVFVIGDQSIRDNIWDKDHGVMYPLLNQQQILEMNAAGFEIGAHSMTHRKLTMIDEKAATDEILRSRILLEILLNKSVHTFSYPFGLVNDTVKNITMDAGYMTACGAYTGPALFGRDLFEIRRILVPDTKNRLRLWWMLQPVHLYWRWFIWRFRYFMVQLRFRQDCNESKY